MVGKRRERRVAAGSDRRRDLVELSNREDLTTQSASSKSNHDRNFFTIFVIIFFTVSTLISLIVYRTRYASRTDASLPHAHQPGFVKTDISYLEVLTENSKVSENTSHRHFTNVVLAYITPWNSRGYEIAKRFNSKFTHLSPVWYDLKSEGPKLILEGRHNVDREWISDLRMKGHAQVLPRVVLEALPSELLKKKNQRNKAIDLIVAECNEMEYDGIVLESWSRWAGYGVLQDPAMRDMVREYSQLSLHAVSLERSSEQQRLQLVYVIGPPYSEKLQAHDFGPEDLKSLSDAVDGFSLMTYDFSGPQRPGPNAPLKWVRSTVQLLLGPTSNGAQSLAHKIFVGLNFYGNDFSLSEGLGGGAIIGSDYLSLLELHRPLLQWDENSAEHFFIYSDDKHVRHAVFYPSLTSIAMRLEEARSWGAGISIWEIGQGLDYFCDLL
ncbi:hypothetical protein RHSIM_Rhsim07G0005700 [Rhododendron simsii]|uniref:Chitinase domain-containing protein 1 n=1 Tax=Rhododendron simsii TaxID=118357 RepID=A0A834GNM8_RHOSS|nr:hypothetical protein RHSIM_Rhsim07G0005700 [Rhododendron simsii]